MLSYSVDSARPPWQDWATGNDPEKVIAAATLLGGYGNMVVSVLSDLVADVLDNAERLGRSAMPRSPHNSSWLRRGVWMGRPPGSHRKRHLADQKLA